MNNVMLTVVSLSVSGSILIAILLLLKPLYKTKLSHRWQYYIWLVVVARLLIPFSFDLNLMESLSSRIFTFSNEAILNQNEMNIPYMSSRVENNALTATTDENIGSVGEVEMFTFIFNATDMYNQTNEVNVTTTPVASNTADSLFSRILPNLRIIWLAIGALLLVRKITIYQGFVRYVMAGASRVDDIKVIEKLGNIMEVLKIKSYVGIYTNGLISSPLIIGFFRPKIVLPTLNIGEDDLKNTLLHELIHHKRGDMFYKWLVQVVICLHWFNPFVHLMGREINKSCEFSCDEAVTKNLNSDEIRNYGDTLINALKHGARYDNTITSLNLGSNCKQLKERLDMIMNSKSKSRFGKIITCVITMFFLIGSAVVGVYAENSNSHNGQEELYIYENEKTVTEIEIGELIIDSDLEFIIPFIELGRMVRIGELVINDGYYANVTIKVPEPAQIAIGARDVPNHILGGTRWMPYSGAVNVLERSVNIGVTQGRHLYVGAHQYSPQPHTNNLYNMIVRIEFRPVAIGITAVHGTQEITTNPATTLPYLHLPSPSHIIENIHQLIPFVSQEIADEFFLYALNTGYNNILLITPFVSELLLEQTIKVIVEEGGNLDSVIMSMIPFVSEAFLDELVLDVVVNRNQDINLFHLLPFMSTAVIEQALSEMLQRGGYVNLNIVAPFVSREFLDELVLSTINR